jgi:hypothetical protein
MELINVKETTPRDRKQLIGLCADIVRGTNKLDTLDHRDACANALDEALEFLASVPREEKENRAEAQSLIKHYIGLIESFETNKAIVSCEICKSSFQGAGPSSTHATQDALRGLAKHVDAVHPNCQACGHSQDDHVVSVCNVGSCRCNRGVCK